MTHVGAGLPAKAVVQSKIQWLALRFRGQARSHRGSGPGADFVGSTWPMWELACLRKRWFSRRFS